MGIYNQVLCTCISCYLCLSMGLMFAWPSCTLKIFESSNTTLDRPMLESELALFGSLSSIGALVSTPIAGYYLDVVGRKYCTIVSSLALVIAWAMIAVCNQVEVVLVAVFISGVGGAVFLIVPTFISEISQESVRGALTSGSMIFYAMGMLLSYFLGGCLEYYVMIYVCLSMSVAGVVMLVVLRESPMFLMKRGLEEEAAKSIAYYRGATLDSKEVVKEMETLRRAFNPDLEEEMVLSIEEQKLKPDKKSGGKEKLSSWKFIKKSKATRQTIFVIIVLVTTSLFQGFAVIQVYAKPLFEEAVPNMSANVCSVLLAVISVVAGLVAAWAIDVAGRRPLQIYSSAIGGLSCIIIGTQLHFHWGPHWVTAVFIYIFTIAYTFGPGSVPYVVTAEAFLPEVKSILSMLIIEIAWLCNVIILFIFTPLVLAVGLGPIFYIFAVICFICTLFSMVYLPETFGVPIDEIPMLFIKKVTL